jgi:hypothetical protein
VVDLTVLSTEIFINYRSFEHQAASDKLQAPEVFRRNELFKQQATGVKPRATSVKRQATGGKLQDARSFVKFNLIKFLASRSERLNCKRKSTSHSV